MFITCFTTTKITLENKAAKALESKTTHWYSGEALRCC